MCRTADPSTGSLSPTSVLGPRMSPRVRGVGGELNARPPPPDWRRVLIDSDDTVGHPVAGGRCAAGARQAAPTVDQRASPVDAQPEPRQLSRSISMTALKSLSAWSAANFA